jgi:hypothetical protein
MTGCLPIYKLHGLCIRSEVALRAPVCQSASFDLDVYWGESFAIPGVPPAGCVLATLSNANGQGYSLTATGTDYTLRFNEICEFRITNDRRSIGVYLTPGVNPGIVPILLTGSVIAFVLTLAGESVLHASAVEFAGSALAFVGGPGMGKSTIAAFLCANGARLITDDLLHVEPDSNGFRCFPGTAEIRLRTSAAALAKQFPAAVSELTADERLAIRLDHHCGPTLPLRAIVIPRPTRTCHTLALGQLTPSKALFCLMSYPKITGWQVGEPIRRQFHEFGHMVKSVPVFEAEIPWGPPFSPELATALLRGVGSDCRFTGAPG